MLLIFTGTLGKIKIKTDGDLEMETPFSYGLWFKLSHGDEALRVRPYLTKDGRVCFALDIQPEAKFPAWAYLYEPRTDGESLALIFDVPDSIDIRQCGHDLSRKLREEFLSRDTSTFSGVTVGSGLSPQISFSEMVAEASKAAGLLENARNSGKSSSYFSYAFPESKAIEFLKKGGADDPSED